MREKIGAGNIYHVMSRGVDLRTIFLDDKDRFRFIHDLFEFNDSKPTSNTNYRLSRNSQSTPSIVIARRYSDRDLLVEILAFCLMPNHYHLLIKPYTDDGLFKFMKKLNMGYARYFNEKYIRKGTLFEGRYKAIIVEDEAHFIHLPYYIHCNALDLAMPEWRKGEIRDLKKAMEFLETYRWSSFPDYIGKENFPSVIHQKFLLDFFGGHAAYRQGMFDWLKSFDLDQFGKIQEVSME